MDMFNTNIGQSISAGGLSNISTLSSLSSGKLSSGDIAPADLIASEHLSSELAEIDAQMTLAQRASSVASVADGAMGEISALLVRAKGLTVASASTGGFSDAEIKANQMELDAINASINRIASSTSFAGQSLFTGDYTLTHDRVSLHLPNVASAALGQVTSGSQSYSASSLSELVGSGDTILASEVIEKSISELARSRGAAGTFRNHVLESSKNYLSNAFANVLESRASIFETDYAEMAAKLASESVFSKMNNILASSTMPMTMTAKEMLLLMLKT